MKPIRTTIVFGIISGLLMIPLVPLQYVSWVWPINHTLLFSIMLAVYSWLICRWSNSNIISVLFPTILLLVAGMWTQTYTGLFFVQFVLFSWIRSGICFTHVPLRSLFAEAITISGGIGFLLYWWSNSTLVLPLAVWFFFLFQTLYFFIVPLESNEVAKSRIFHDAFEEANLEIERILLSQKFHQNDLNVSE